MPSKISKRKSTQSALWKAVPDCSEPDIRPLATALARELRPGDRVALEGPLGAGKSTFARAILEALGVRQAPEGSPSFAIAHEYDSPKGSVVHADLYRLRSEAEIEEAGIAAYLWEREAIVLLEWLSLWPQFESAASRPEPGRSFWRVELRRPAEKGQEEFRTVRIERLEEPFRA